MNLPDCSKLDDNHRQVLHQQAIDEKVPGAIVGDFEVLLRFIGEDSISVSSKYELLPLKSLPQLNSQMAHPIEISLKRPQQKSYPHLNGLYLLLRATGLAYVESTRTGGRLMLDRPALQSWQDLSLTERYFTLLEAWLLKSRLEILGERGGYLEVPIMKWADFFRRIPAEGLAIAGNKDQELTITYFPGLYTVALLEMFGFISVQHDKPEAGKGWRIVRLQRTPFGDAMLQLLSDLLPSDEYLGRPDDETGVAFGELQDIIQPFFPDWRRNLTLPELQFQDGIYIFKVSLGRKIWRRVAIPGDDEFESLSGAILQAFDFDNDHLYQFSYKNRFGVTAHIKHPYLEEPPFTTEVRIGDIGMKPGATITYLFDFGDNWNFHLELEGIDSMNPNIKAPAVLETQGKAPKQYPNLDDDDWDE